MAGMPRHPWPKGLRPRLPSADKSQPSKAPDTQNGPWALRQANSLIREQSLLDRGREEGVWRLVPLGWCGHEILEVGVRLEPPLVTRPGHMAEPQTFHS